MINKLKKHTSEIADGGIAILIIIAILVAIYGISWIITCGIIKLITMCFGLTFKWNIATGIWFVILLLKEIFSVTVNTQTKI